ncbi:MarR family winged helix-turn-helix transcriptional regulator [Clostridium botulinum]|uniref:MarR family transcriptional regulator n=1 Tax=Clostridium botulinum TaxID=1491 RepID=A0A9Q1UWW8_CLOBO|nr:MarR family transcriptional regulator [Clostridium botulinum]AEB76399.1 putative transcriptional regulator, MarR family [Clostridium botulinum BKT015925]KEI01254.1 MarR family transcriptional regulator [Clostridium botulinum D str. 16868]KEI04866.1 MarR family transcriptional regulator [Clostridium botulinum C/D str. Sp77]KLU75942.1 MarR family transcriptional regulator [Clostridium botulinum V891]KOA75616.1 MarR family transcriptional regulator [Clostridium botulinum]
MKYVFEESVAYMLNKVVLKIKKELTSRFNKYDVTIEQWRLLTRLWKVDGISQTQLAIRCSKDLPTVTRMLDKLEKKEVIERKEDPNDSRAYLVFLTEKGKGLEEKLDPIAYEIENKSIQNVRKEDIEVVKKVLDIMITNLD